MQEIIPLPIVTTATLRRAVALDILNAAINGACDAWAAVAEKEADSAYPGYARATFVSRADTQFSVVISAREIAKGMQNLLVGDIPVAPQVKEKVLRIVATNDAQEVDAETADNIVRAAMLATFGYMRTY